MSIKSLNKIATLILALILVLPGLSYGAGDDKAGENDQGKEIATVNGTIITQGDLNGELGRLKTVLMQRGQMPTDNDMAVLKKVAIDSLIEQELLFQTSQDLKTKIDQAVIDEQYEALKKNFPDEKAFMDLLDKRNITEETVKKQLARTQYIQNYINDEFVQKTTVPDEEVQKFYDENSEKLILPESMKVSHILVAVKPDADEKAKAEAKDKLAGLKKEIDGGADFAELAKNNSDCPSKDQGGDLGFISREQVVKPFADAAFALKSGEMSDIVETRFGYHLIKAFEHKEASIIPLEDVRDKIVSYLKQEKVRKNLAEKVAEVKKGARIEILDPDLKAVPKAAPKEESKEAPKASSN